MGLSCIWKIEILFGLGSIIHKSGICLDIVSENKDYYEVTICPGTLSFIQVIRKYSLEP